MTKNLLKRRFSGNGLAEISCEKCNLKAFEKELWCEECSSLIPFTLLTQKNEFEMFGIEPEFEIDPEELFQKFKDLQRQLNTKKFSRAGEQRLKLEQTIQVVNQSYMTLRNDFRRGNLLLKILGQPCVVDDFELSEPDFFDEIVYFSLELFEKTEKEDLENLRWQIEYRRDTFAEYISYSFFHEFYEQCLEELKMIKNLDQMITHCDERLYDLKWI